MASAAIRRGLGITSGLDAGLARELAARAEASGYASLWANDEPDARGLDTLAQFAAVTRRVELGVGVLPLHRYTASEIAAEVARLALDPARLWVGIGAGALPRQVEPLRGAVGELRALLPPAVRIMVAAMRPGLCRLGGEIADGVLLNWMPPGAAARARTWVHEGAAGHGRPAPIVASYVRVAVGAGADARLCEEERAYRVINLGHRRHFAALGVPLGSVGIAGAHRSDVVEALTAYHAALDLPIVRVLAAPEIGAVRAVVDAAAP